MFKEIKSILFPFLLAFLMFGFTIFKVFSYYYFIDLITKPYLITFVIILGVFILKASSSKLGVLKLGVLKSLYYKIFFIFLIYISISYLLNFSNEFVFRKFWLFFSNGFLITILASSFEQKEIKYLPFVILFFAFFQTIVFYIIYINIGNLTEVGWTLIKTLHLDIILISRTLGFGVIISYLFVKNKLYKTILSIYFFIQMYLLNEVGPILSVLVVLFLILVFKKRKINILYYIFLLIIFILVYQLIVIKYIPDLSFQKIDHNARVSVYQKSINLFFNNPVFGLGIAGLSRVSGSYQSSHNVFLEIACEFGIVGLLLFGALLIIIVRNLFTKENEKLKFLWIYAFLVIQFSADISLNPFFWFMSSLIIRNNFLKKINKNYYI